jgi:hypothetical protein
MSADGLWRDEPRWLRIVADPRIFAAACAWLFVLTILGTLAQRDIGLYLAQERYFSSWFVWLAQIPLPGGRLTLSVTGLNLLAILFTRRSTTSPGLFVLHAGTLMLLAGCMIGGALRQEGSLALAEGESGDEMRSWRHHELAIIIDGTVNDRLLTVGEDRLRQGQTITHPDLPVALTVVDHLVNCRPTSGGIEPLLPEKEIEQNAPGVVLRLPDSSQVSVCENGPAVQLAPGIRAGIRRMGTVMPFSIELLKFQRENYPGTGMARRFSSEVNVHEAGASRRVVISMNRPLRIGPWTLYQQSYSQTSDGTMTSVLAVVRDRFQFSPYLASSIMLIGLILHIVLRMRRPGTAS